MNREERLGDPEEALRLALEDRQSQMWTALPGIVTSVNLSAQTVAVQPTIQGVVSSPNGAKQSVNLPVLVDVPIVWPRAGGFALTFPIAVGDEVLVVFASRCIDSWWQSGGIGSQAEARMHDLSDGFAVLAPTSQAKKLSGVSTSNVQLRNYAGTTFVEITPSGGIMLKATGSITVEAPTINLTGNIVHSGGSAMSLGKKIDGTHTHSGVQSGSSNTGVPNV